MVSVVTAVRNVKISALLFSKIFVLCAGFSWGRVNLLHNGYCGGMFWICAQKWSVDNTGMSSLFADQNY